MSIGETSQVQIQNINIEETYIGIAVKDSSLLDVGNANIDTSNYCFAAYRKKQEFDEYH